MTSFRWRVGQRVCREDEPTQLGDVVEIAPDTIKVKWDNGRTSYYRLDRHIPLTETEIARCPPNNHRITARPARTAALRCGSRCPSGWSHG
jgi:hypothetical protein